MIQRITMVGGRGYAGEELLRLLASHGGFAVHRVISRSLAGKHVREVYPELDLDFSFENATALEVARDCGDGVVLALGNGEAQSWVRALPRHIPIVDFSADYRFDPKWVYGLPERFEETLRGARRVANPGCYATAAQLALLPIKDLIVTPPALCGLSGFSGAGRRPSPKNDPDRIADNVLPYSLTGHMHEREISAQLGHAVHFMPHVMPFFRGLSVTANALLRSPLTRDDLVEKYLDFYGEGGATSVSEEIPEIAMVRGRAGAIVGGFAVDGPRVVVLSVLDNLLKGAASQALQNLNLMFDRPLMEGI